MDTRMMARVLDSFGRRQEKSGAARKSGLGLPLAKQLVEAHGGSFDIVSEPGEGTIVTLTLP